MDSYRVGEPRPQFNVVYFNRRLHLQTNTKFSQELSNFITADAEFADLFGYLNDDLQTVLTKQSLVVNDDDDMPVVTRWGDTILFSLAMDEAKDLANIVLQKASPVSYAKKDFPLNSMVAFGKRLLAISEGDEPKPKFREVIIERRIVR